MFYELDDMWDVRVWDNSVVFEGLFWFELMSGVTEILLWFVELLF